jgi:hypothetical protein
MDAAEIIAQLSVRGKLPVEAIKAARANSASVAPHFVEVIEKFVSGADRSTADPLFFIFHLLGEWREKSAYRPLARLLRCPPDDIDQVFGDAATETSHRVMAAVFDGDPKPLYDLIHDPEVDEFIRSRMVEAVAMVTLNGELPRGEASRFLQACYSDIVPQDECFVWKGWQQAIAMLGLVELKSLVERAFKRGFVSSWWLRFHHFEDDLRKGIDDPRTLLGREHALFGDTIEELSHWNSFRPESEREPELTPRNPPPSGKSAAISYPPQTSPVVPAVNPHRNVGRNHPCPCGSGKKFKKCCLTAAA